MDVPSAYGQGQRQPDSTYMGSLLAVVGTRIVDLTPDALKRHALISCIHPHVYSLVRQFYLWIMSYRTKS